MLNNFFLMPVLVSVGMVVFASSSIARHHHAKSSPATSVEHRRAESPNYATLNIAKHQELSYAPDHQGDQSDLVASLQTQQMMRDYLQTSLSPVPALMFAPASVTLAFVPLVNKQIDESENTYLHLAARSGDPFYTWQLLELGANPAARNRSHRTPVEMLGSVIAEAEEFLLPALNPSQDSFSRMTTHDSPTHSVTDSGTETIRRATRNPGVDRPALIGPLSI